MNQQSIYQVSSNAAKLKAMSEQLDRDIASAATACVMARDAELIEQLCESIAEEHPFMPCLRAMVNELRAPEIAGNQPVIEGDRAKLYDIVRDATESRTETVAAESDERLAFFRMALALVPKERLGLLARGVRERLVEFQGEVYDPIPENELETLKTLSETGLKA